MNQYGLNIPGTEKEKPLPTWPAFSIGFLLILSVIFPAGFVTGMNIYLLVLALFVWVGKRKKFDKNLLLVVAPFGIIIFIGLAAGAGAERYLYLKDAWYVANPAIIICVGFIFYLCKPDVSRGLRAFVIGGTLVSLFYLTRIIMNPELLANNGIAIGIREEVGTGYYASALSFTIFCAYFGKWREGLKLPNWLAWCCFTICVAGVIACFSRTMLIVAIIGLLAATGVFGRREWLKIGVILSVALLIIFTLRVLFDADSSEMQKTFVGKLARSLDEIKIEEYQDIKSINLSWRGYESARVLRDYKSGTPLQWFFGHGFGALVDLGFYQTFGEETQRYIPVFHNGFMYLLTKGGPVAIGLYIFSLARLYLVGRKVVSVATDRIISAPAKVLQATALTITFTTWLIMGSFNKSDMFPYLLVAGFLLAALTHVKDNTE